MQPLGSPPGPDSEVARVPLRHHSYIQVCPHVTALGYLDTVSLFSKTVGTTASKTVASGQQKRSCPVDGQIGHSWSTEMGNMGWSLESVVSPRDEP